MIKAIINSIIVPMSSCSELHIPEPEHCNNFMQKEEGRADKMLKRKEREVCKRASLWATHVAIHSELTCSDASTIYRCLINPSPSITAEIIELANKGHSMKKIIKILYTSSYIGFVEGEKE